MPLRVTQAGLYTTMLSGMQSNLSELMALVEQGSSQKQVNRPSDNPAGITRILDLRHQLAGTHQTQTNVDTATGWLALGDTTLTQVSTVISSIKALAEQASTGTYDGTNREQMSFQAQQLFEQLINLSNTRFEGNCMFAGHKYTESAFDMRLGVTTWDPDLQDVNFTVEGDSNHSIAIEFQTDGTVGGGDDLDYRWTNDGGKTWRTGTLTAGQTELDLDGVRLTIPAGSAVTAATAAPGTTDDETGDAGALNGTCIYIRAAAFYNGDTNDVQDQVSLMGGTQNLRAEAHGLFKENLLIRTETNANLTTAGQALRYSYSLDNGASWISAEVETPTPAANSVRLVVPGGYVNVSLADPGVEPALPPGTQFVVHPDRASLDYRIADNGSVTVNNVGKDIFGGQYVDDNGVRRASLTEETNLLEIAANFTAYLENNNQEGCQQTLKLLTSAQTHILTEAARIGGMENRLSQSSDMLSFQELDQKSRISYIEDIDLSKLLTKITQQQTAYQTVLKSSSMIMGMNLTNYL